MGRTFVWFRVFTLGPFFFALLSFLRVAAQAEKIPYMGVIGDKELEQGGVSIRERHEGDLGIWSEEKLYDESAQYWLYFNTVKSGE